MSQTLSTLLRRLYENCDNLDPSLTEELLITLEEVCKRLDSTQQQRLETYFGNLVEMLWEDAEQLHWEFGLIARRIQNLCGFEQAAVERASDCLDVRTRWTKHLKKASEWLPKRFESLGSVESFMQLRSQAVEFAKYASKHSVSFYLVLDSIAFSLKTLTGLLAAAFTEQIRDSGPFYVTGFTSGGHFRARDEFKASPGVVTVMDTFKCMENVFEEALDGLPEIPYCLVEAIDSDICSSLCETTLSGILDAPSLSLEDLISLYQNIDLLHSRFSGNLTRSSLTRLRGRCSVAILEQVGETIASLMSKYPVQLTLLKSQAYENSSPLALSTLMRLESIVDQCPEALVQPVSYCGYKSLTQQLMSHLVPQDQEPISLALVWMIKHDTNLLISVAAQSSLPGVEDLCLNLKHLLTFILWEPEPKRVLDPQVRESEYPALKLEQAAVLCNKLFVPKDVPPYIHVPVVTKLRQFAAAVLTR